MHSPSLFRDPRASSRWRRLAVFALLAVATTLGGGCPDDAEIAPCQCALVLGRATTSYRCEAFSMPPGASLCEQLPTGQLFCGAPDSSPEFFEGESVSCDPGFCVSEDGETCATVCGCSN